MVININNNKKTFLILNNWLKKIISVSDNVDPVLRDQARAYAKDMEKVVAFYMKEAIRSDRTTVYNAIKDAGHPKLAELIRRL